jgi:hypothetical protein
MKYAKTTYRIIICCGIFVLLQYAYRYHFYYIEQLQLFRFSKQYAADTIIRPGGLSLYIARFLVRFYAFPAIGALVTAILLTSASILTYRLAEKFLPPRISLLVSLLPACGLFILHTDMNYNIQGTVAYLIALTIINVYITIDAGGKRLAAGFAIVPALFFVAGSVVSLFAIFVVIWELIRKNPRWYLILLLQAEVALIGLAAMRLSLQGELRMLLLPDAYYDPLIKNKIVYYPWCALLISIIAAWLFRRRTMTAPVTLKREAVTVAMTLLPFFTFLTLTCENDKRLILKTVEQDYYLRNGRWDKIIETFPAKRHNLQIMNVMNLALAQTNRLGDRLFDYRPQGYESLLAEWDDTQVNAIALSDIYYHIGDIAVAQKLAFEGMVSSLNGGNVRLLQRLIETNIIFGEYAVAEKYIRLLEQTLLYKGKAQRYRTFLYNDTAVENDRTLGNKRKALIKNNTLAVSNNTIETLEQLVENHAENPLPMQYLLATCLMNKDLKTFRALLDKHFRTAMLPSLSISHQEAVIALEQDNPGFWIKNGVSASVEKKFRAFDASMTENHTIPGFESVMQSSYGNTYWYYLLFNNIKPIKPNAPNNLYHVDSHPHSAPHGGGGGGETPQTQNKLQRYYRILRTTPTRRITPR